MTPCPMSFHLAVDARRRVGEPVFLLGAEQLAARVREGAGLREDAGAVGVGLQLCRARHEPLLEHQQIDQVAEGKAAIRSCAGWPHRPRAPASIRSTPASAAATLPGHVPSGPSVWFCAPSAYELLATSWSSQIATIGCWRCTSCRSSVALVLGVAGAVVGERHGLGRPARRRAGCRTRRWRIRRCSRPDEPRDRDRRARRCAGTR